MNNFQIEPLTCNQNNSTYFVDFHPSQQLQDCSEQSEQTPDTARMSHLENKFKKLGVEFESSTQII